MILSNEYDSLARYEYESKIRITQRLHVFPSLMNMNSSSKRLGVLNNLTI